MKPTMEPTSPEPEPEMSEVVLSEAPSTPKALAATSIISAHLEASSARAGRADAMAMAGGQQRLADHSSEEDGLNLMGRADMMGRSPLSVAVSPKTGLSRDDMLQRTQDFIDQTGASEEAALEMLIPALWSMADAIDSWEEVEKERRYETDRLGIGTGLETGLAQVSSLWSWGSAAVSKAADVASERATELTKEVEEATVYNQPNSRRSLRAGRLPAYVLRGVLGSSPYYQK